MPREALRIEDVPVPELGANDVLVAVKACGVCGTDVHFWQGETPLPQLPLTLGHEPAGVVAAVGSGVVEWKIGDRVIVTGSMPCRACQNCRQGDFQSCTQIIEMGIDVDGAFAEFVRTAREGLIALPDSISFEVGAMLGDAIATPYHALVARGQLQAGESVAIWGCGGLGLHAVKLARLLGAGKIIGVDVRPAALEQALAFGADDVVDVSRERAWQRIHELTNGVDLIVEFVGLSDALNAALRSLRRGGRLVNVGMRAERMKLLPSTLFAWYEYSLIGAFGCTLSEIHSLVELIESGRISFDDSVSLRLPLEEINRALTVLYQKIDDPIRVMIIPE